MFYDAYDNYIRYAFPMDELNPVNCSGRGRDWDNPLVVLSVSCITLTHGYFTGIILISMMH